MIGWSYYWIADSGGGTTIVIGIVITELVTQSHPRVSIGFKIKT